MRINRGAGEGPDKRPGERNVARRVTKNSLFLLVSTGLGIVTRLAIFPIVARYLGLQSFGLFTLILAISMAITPIANFGVERIVFRELSTSKVNHNTFFSTTVIAKIFLSLFLCVLSIISIRLFSPWDAQVNLALMLGILEQLVFCMGQTYLAAVRASEKMEFDTLANFAHKLSLFGLILAAVLLDWGFTGIFWARFAASVLFILAAVAMTYTLFLKPRIRFRMAYAKHIITESFPVMIFSLLLSLIFRVDVFILGWLGTASEVALFEGPHRLISQIQVLATSISFAIFPVLSRAYSENRMDLLQTYYDTTYKFVLIIGMLGTILIYVAGKPLIILLLGRDFASAVLSMQIMSPIVVCLFLVLLQTSFLLAIGQQGLNTLAVGIALVVNIILDLILIPGYSYAGASLATMISYFIFMALSGEFIRKQGIQYRHGKRVLTILVICLAMMGIEKITLANDFYTLAVRCGIGTVVYLAAILMFKVITVADLKSTKDIFRMKRKRRRGRDVS